MQSLCVLASARFWLFHDTVERHDGGDMGRIKHGGFDFRRHHIRWVDFGPNCYVALVERTRLFIRDKPSTTHPDG